MSKNKHKWFVDFSEIKRKSHRVHDDNIPSPPGYTKVPPKDDESTSTADASLVTKMGWSIALGPWKQLPLNLLVLWMAGNTISLFPIMMVGMTLWRSLQAIFSCREVFKKLSGDQAYLQMAVYLLANVVGTLLVLYKVNAMGLLPTSQSDWLEFMVVRESDFCCFVACDVACDKSPVACIESQATKSPGNLRNLELAGGGVALT